MPALLALMLLAPAALARPAIPVEQEDAASQPAPATEAPKEAVRWTAAPARPMSAAQIARAVHMMRTQRPATPVAGAPAPADGRLATPSPRQEGKTAIEKLSEEGEEGQRMRRPRRASIYASIKPEVDKVRRAVQAKVESRTELLRNMSLFVSRKIRGERGYYLSFSELENKKRDMGAALEFKKGDGMAVGMPSVGALVKKDGVIVNTPVVGGRF